MARTTEERAKDRVDEYLANLESDIEANRGRAAALRKTADKIETKALLKEVELESLRTLEMRKTMEHQMTEMLRKNPHIE